MVLHRGYPSGGGVLGGIMSSRTTFVQIEFKNHPKINFIRSIIPISTIIKALSELGVYLHRLFVQLDVYSPDGKTRRFDYPSPEDDNLFKHQITRPFAISIRIGPKRSRGPFFPYNVYT
jgi:hypothetical protein